MKSICCSMFAWILLLVCTEQTYAQDIITVQKKLSEEQVQKIIQESELKIHSILKKEIYLPGLAVALVSRDEILWTESFGYRDKSRTAMVDTNTIFGVLSVSKPTTVTGLMMAAQEGLIDLDVPIKQYLPEFAIQSRLPVDPMSKITM
jgi:CubicO group peptidase (beta-lactamase class C family)